MLSLLGQLCFNRRIYITPILMYNSRLKGIKRQKIVRLSPWAAEGRQCFNPVQRYSFWWRCRYCWRIGFEREWRKLLLRRCAENEGLMQLVRKVHPTGTCIIIPKSHSVRRLNAALAKDDQRHGHYRTRFLAKVSPYAIVDVAAVAFLPGH